MSRLRRFLALGRTAAARFGEAAGLSRYRAANAALTTDPDRRPRVVFLGDSILAGWPDLAGLVPEGWRCLNRSVSGQTSAQMLRRFQTDVLALSPAAVVILAGTNDVRGGVSAVAVVSRNIRAMTTLARARGVQAILATVPPVIVCPGARPSAARRDPRTIVAVNEWLEGFAEESGCAVADFHGALVGARGAFARPLTHDGVHPNAEGYAAMARVLKPVLDAVLRTSGR